MIRNFISSFVEKVHEKIDPSYLKKKENVRQNLMTVGLVSTASLVMSTAFGIFGIALTNSAKTSVLAGLSVLLVSLPMGYLSYNVYKVSGNAKSIIDDPKLYWDPLKSEKGLKGANIQKVKRKLEEGTIGFSWVIDCAVTEGIKVYKAKKKE